MKWLVAAFLVLLGLAIVASAARSVLSRKNAVFDAVVEIYEPQSGNESRNTPLPGEITAVTASGRRVHLVLDSPDEVRRGTKVRIAEMVAPWGEVWYRMARNGE